MMALTTQLWTLNALSVELGISSRVLGKRLSDLAPDQVEQQAGRQVKRWRLARVLKHLKAAGAKAEVDERSIEDHKHVVSEFLFPAVMSSRYFLGFYLAYLHEDIGLTKVQALQAYGAVVIALHHAIAEFFAGVDAELAGEPLPGDIEDHELEVRIPPVLTQLATLGPEAYAAKYWSR